MADADVSGYRTLRVSDETAFDLVRALWLAERANEREGIVPASPEARQAEAFGRMIREWTAITLPSQPTTPEFLVLTNEDWRCPCGSTGLNKGGLQVRQSRVLCRACASS